MREVDNNVKKIDKERERRLDTEAREGNTDSFISLLEMYRDNLYQLSYLWVRDHHDADDVLNISYEKAYKHFPKFRGDSNVSTWLYRIVINSAKNYVKQRDRVNMVSLESVEEHGDRADGHTLPHWYKSLLNDDKRHSLSTLLSPENIYERNQVIDMITNCLDDMPESLLETWLYCESEDLRYQDIADKMDIPIGTVRSRIFLAREMLAEALERRIRSHN